MKIENPEIRTNPFKKSPARKKDGLHQVKIRVFIGSSDFGKFRKKVTLEINILDETNQPVLASSSEFDNRKSNKTLNLTILKTEDKIKDSVVQMLKDNTKLTSLHRTFAQEWTRKSPMKDPEFVKKWQTDYFEDFFDHFGVLSLTANPNNDNMWEAYSDNHQGFCVGFNTIRLFQHLGGGGDVNYYDELPIIYPTPKYTYEQQHILLVFSKLRKWDYEEEYRAHKFYPYALTDNQRRIPLPSACYKKLIFGKNMPEPIMEQLLISIPNDLGHLILIDE